MRFEADFNNSWYFLKMDVDATKDDALKVPEEKWNKVTLPHDWLIFNTKNLYEDSTGWYRKWFGVYLNKNKSYYVNFDGIYMDSTIYVNGKKAGENHYGYSSFELDITDYLEDGENEILVRVCHRSPNSRWYSGAGIFRNVTYKELEKTHIANNGVYISAKKAGDTWLVITDTEVEGPDADKVTFSHNVILKKTEPQNAGTILRACPGSEGFVVKDSSNGDNCARCGHSCPSRDNVRVANVEYNGNSCTFVIENPFVWDIETPNLYELRTAIFLDGVEIDSVENIFGLKEAVFTTERGLILNGRRVKINGVCEHHDFGCLGAGFNKDAMRRKIVKLKEMGVNAIRTSHNIPAKGLMELADEMGIMIDSECFDMWRHPKTTYDYSRFFKDDYKKDIESWIKRDRNHPSVIMWSIGNEILDCHEDADAPELAADMKETVEKYDYLHNAPVTNASNYMAWQGARNCAEVYKLAGYNYGEMLYDGQHKEHPDWMIYGSETSSTVQSRGVYHFPLKQTVLADDDLQCSALGNCTTPWGAKSTEFVVTYDRDREYSAGQFIWTGFDYIGEPTPYETKNSYFGQLDTAGFPKDTYYIYKAAWTDPKKAPFVHIYPYWDFNEGQTVDVRITSNADAVELICNGESLGRKNIDHAQGEEAAVSWQIPYRKGYIEAKAFDGDGREIACERRSSFGEVKELKYTGNVFGRLAFYEIYAVDAEGNAVENANSRVKVKAVKGKLLGMDNGDSTDYDEYKTDNRRMFNGKLLAVVEENEDGESDIELSVCPEDIPVRKIELSLPEGNLFSEDKRTLKVRYRVLPENTTYGKIVFRGVTERGAESNLCEIEEPEKTYLPGADSDENIVLVKGLGDGAFTLRAMAYNDSNHAMVISEAHFEVKGIGPAFINPYKYVSGSLYTCGSGEVAVGNEKGVVMPKGENSFIGYENVDFGSTEATEVTIDIYVQDSKEHPVSIWAGKPGEEGSCEICSGTYCKPFEWNRYQPESFRLKTKMSGKKDIFIRTEDGIHIKGFIFK